VTGAADIDRPARELAARVRAGALSAEDLATAALARIRAHDGALRAVLRTMDDAALAAARAVDAAVTAGRDPGPLAGVPIAIKDNICTRDTATTAASRILEGFVPPYDATVVDRLRRAGAVLVAKTNLDEFAMGSSCENSAFGACRNPWDPARVPGGSSGGSAVAVAAGLAAGALGTDTGGSIRLPASFCGVVGLKPSYGRVSRSGVIAFASSLDQVGPFARDALDAALLLAAIAGHDPADATSSTRPVPAMDGLADADVRGLRIGVPAEYFGAGLEPAVEEAVRAAIATLEADGAEIVPVAMPHTRYAIPTYYLVTSAEASSNLARYDGVRYGLRAADVDLEGMYGATRDAGFGAEVKRRIMLGTYALSAGYYDAYYAKAGRARGRIAGDFREAFGRCDVLAGPVAPGTAFPIGARIDDPVSMYLSDVLTTAVNLAGLPALSVPCGFDRAGLPIGLHLIGRSFDEYTLLGVAAAYQRATDWHRRRPDV
jgi:aspartyl-tRNA(Asn)/glutamyl-tRNA(Gln) amidotransferase subunit A